jgi:hypothetical protein
MESPARFITRPTAVMAMQWTGSNAEALAQWTKKAFVPPRDDMDAQLWADSVAHYIAMEVGDWVVQNDLGFYPRKEASFKVEFRKMLPDEAVTVEFGHVYFTDGINATPGTNGIPLIPIHPGDDINTDGENIWIDTADGKHIPLGKVGK